jgi:hypothetical protein
MTDSEHHPKPKSSAAWVVLMVFIGVAVFGFVLIASGYLFALPIGETLGLLLILIGVVGAIVSGIVLIAQPKTPHQQPASLSAGPAPGWYPDPENPAQFRYFDGRVWTSSTQLRQ